MRNFRTAAATIAATGIAAFGAAAASGGVANAATNVSITNCSIASSTISIGVTPTCTALPGTIVNPTKIKIVANGSFLNALGTIIPMLGVKVSYKLDCRVDGADVITPTQSYLVTSPTSTTQVVDLQKLVGSSAPNQCTVQDLTATSTAAVTLAGSLPSFTFGVAAYGDNGTPGTIWAQYPGGRTVCADDRANGNAGSIIQAYQCENDLADGWIHLPNGQFVHNGDCLTNDGGQATIQKCAVAPDNTSNQVWTAENPGKAGTLTNGGNCLSAPTSGQINGTQLTVEPCHAGDYGQVWKVPDVTPL